jgi:DNA-binding NtrC family response regulator
MSSQHPSRILVVDDEPLIRWAMAETLAYAGYTVNLAASAWETLEQLRTGETPDVILLDFRLPDSHDLQLLAAIRQQSPDSAVIMATAFGTPEVIRGATELGACHVVDKPIDMAALPGMVEDAYQRAV